MCYLPTLPIPYEELVRGLPILSIPSEVQWWGNHVDIKALSLVLTLFKDDKRVGGGEHKVKIEK
jgi:hypothetical protein